MHLDRRFLIIVGSSLAWGLVVSLVFYRMALGGRRAAPEKTLIVASEPLSPGTAITAGVVKTTRVPENLFPKGAYSRVEDVVGRPVISSIGPDEPVVDSRLAARGSGFGVAPMIPTGMRAVSVRVNDVAGVAGFVLPGMRVDVLVTGKPPGADDTFTTTVLQNVTVLSAGQTIQSDGKSQSMSVPVVTLLVDPLQAESLTLAANEGHIQLVLRNSAIRKWKPPRAANCGSCTRTGLPSNRSQPAADAGARPTGPPGNPRRRPNGPFAASREDRTTPDNLSRVDHPDPRESENHRDISRGTETTRGRKMTATNVETGWEQRLSSTISKGQSAVGIPGTQVQLSTASCSTRSTWSGPPASENDICIRAEVKHAALMIVEQEPTLLTASEKEEISEEVLHEVFGLGPGTAVCRTPRFPTSWSTATARCMWSARAFSRPDVRFHDNGHLLRIIDRIVSQVGRRVDESNPMVDARLLDGSRVNAIIPPLAVDGPLLSIRRFGTDRLMPSDLVDKLSLTPGMMRLLEATVRARLNIIVSGGTGAGKNDLARMRFPRSFRRERIVTIEDAAELQLAAP